MRFSKGHTVQTSIAIEIVMTTMMILNVSHLHHRNLGIDQEVEHNIVELQLQQPLH